MGLAVLDPFHLDLTAARLVADGLRPIVAGDDWWLRFQLRFTDRGAYDLTSMAITFVIFSNPAFIRSSAAVVPGTTLKQIAFDPQQFEQIENDTGRGWYQINGGHQDKSALIHAIGILPYTIKGDFTDGKTRVLGQGRVEVLRNRLG